MKKGFTLIELVVAIAIIGILAGIGIPRFLDAQATARGAKIIADLRTIDSAYNLYNIKTGTWIEDYSFLTTDAPDEKKYLLLATWPSVPSGSAIFPCMPGRRGEVTNGKYILNASTHRAEAVMKIDGVDHTFNATTLAAGSNVTHPATSTLDLFGYSFE